MDKIKFITDSAGDIPPYEAKEYGIEVLPIPIVVDDEAYMEGCDFTNRQFYDILLKAKHIPKTSQVSQTRYADAYRHAALDGYNKIITVTINSKGSSTFAAANMAKDLFSQDFPDLAENVEIAVVDSLCYTYTYGYAVVQAAKKAREGKSFKQILRFLDDYFNRAETYFSVYSLDFAKKSGRISVAAAFVGEVLGMRPVMSIIDGEIKIIAKVRGDRAVVPKLCEIAKSRRSGPDTPFFTIRAAKDNVAEDLEKLLKKDFGNYSIGTVEAGASVTINAGPYLVGCMVLGEPRSKGGH